MTHPARSSALSAQAIRYLISGGGVVALDFLSFYLLTRLWPDAYVAATGRHDHVLMATHWAFIRQLKKRYPTCQFVAHPSCLQADGIWTTGSLTGGFDALLERARSADTAWREEWFTPEYWKEIRPWLGEVAETAARFGPVRRLVLVGRQDQGDERGFVYRVDYAELSRVIRYRVDGQGRIASRTLLDE